MSYIRKIRSKVIPFDFWNYPLNPITGFTHEYNDNKSSKQVTEHPTPLSLR